MLKRQIELKLVDNWDAVRTWNTIPDRYRQQVVELYARLIGNAAMVESTTHIVPHRLGLISRLRWATDGNRAGQPRAMVCFGFDQGCSDSTHEHMNCRSLDVMSTGACLCGVCGQDDGV